MSARIITREGHIELDGDTVPFTLVRVARRRNVHVMVDDDGRLSVRAPWRYSIAAAGEAIVEHRVWVTESLRSARERLSQRPALAPGSELPLLDERLRLNVRVNAQMSLLPARKLTAPCSEPSALERRDGTVYRKRDRLHVELCTLRGDALESLLREWFRREAKHRLPDRLLKLAGQLGVRPGQVRVRAQKSCWGSCSSGGHISLNWRLVMLPLELADYVMVHELCHLRHMNHSSDFWNLVASLIPDYRRRREHIAAMQPVLAL